jgi:UrcA family protein
MHKILVPAAMLAALAVSPVNTAAAADGTLKWTRVVRYADLDLSREAGAETLYARLVAAARRVCEPDVFATHATVGKPHCMEHALDAAVASVNAPTLTELFQQKQAAVPVAHVEQPN